jgi:hypothetical protein
MLSRMKFDIDPFIMKALDSLPVSVWESTTTTFMDPALGGAQFVRVIEQRLRNHGHSDSNIRTRVFGFEESELHIRYAVNKYKLVGQYAKRPYIEIIKSGTDMKFDVIVGNPPYNGKAALHQQFFNKGYELLNNNGTLAFIQPATTYFNKKDKQKGPVNDMIEIIKNNVCTVYIENPEVFENAGIQNDLSITILTKTPSVKQTIESITFKNGNTYTDVSLNDITMTQINPTIYSAIRTKYEKFIAINGNLENKISKSVGTLKASLGKIRGTRPTDADFYTFIPLRENRSNYGASAASEFGVALNSAKEVDFVYDYLESYVARFGLAILKFSQNTANKEFALVPLVLFNQYYTDSDLYNMIGLTADEVNEIKKVIVPLYAR